MNRWGIPADVEGRVSARDLACIYCRRPFGPKDGPRGQRASWEHIINDVNLSTDQNIALCCISCNASKGAKSLRRWLESRYCRLRGIDATNIAPIARCAWLAEMGDCKKTASDN
jgi:hypothetical protein